MIKGEWGWLIWARRIFKSLETMSHRSTRTPLKSVKAIRGRVGLIWARRVFKSLERMSHRFARTPLKSIMPLHGEIIVGLLESPLIHQVPTLATEGNLDEKIPQKPIHCKTVVHCMSAQSRWTINWTRSMNAPLFARSHHTNG